MQQQNRRVGMYWWSPLPSPGDIAAAIQHLNVSYPRWARLVVILVGYCRLTRSDTGRPGIEANVWHHYPL